MKKINYERLKPEQAKEAKLDPVKVSQAKLEPVKAEGKRIDWEATK